MKCITCGSQGFDVLVLGPDRCTFCDGTEGGNPPTQEDIEEAKDRSKFMERYSTPKEK